MLLRAGQNQPVGGILRCRISVGRLEMFVVETYAAVRRFVFMEGHSRWEAARLF